MKTYIFFVCRGGARRENHHGHPGTGVRVRGSDGRERAACDGVEIEFGKPFVCAEIREVTE